MKNLRVSVNKHKYEIHFDYNEEFNELLIEIIDSKGNQLDRHKTNVIIKELIKGFRIEESCMALQVLRKKDSPIILYTDDEGNINPSLFYERNDFDTMDEVELNIPKLKIEKVFNIGTQIATYFLLLGLIINFCQDKINEKKFNESIKSNTKTVSENFSEDYISDSILLNQSLKDEQKNLLTSNSFIRDLAATTMSNEQKTILCFQLNNLKIEEYNTIQKSIYSIKELFNKDNLYGYVLDGEHLQNTIHMLETETAYSDYVLIHEFIHIVQLDNEYSYLKEASAEIIAHEYWDRPIITYQNAVKRIYALMAIIGPETIWNANFTSTNQLTEELSKYLESEEVERFMNCLKVKPYNQKISEETGIGNIDQELDRLIKKIYEKKFNKRFSEDNIIQAIYNMDNSGNIVSHIEENNIKSPIYFFNRDKFSDSHELDIQKIK